MREIHDERPSLFPGVPKIYALIADAAADGRHDLSSIRSCLCGAGALPTAVAERFQSLTGGHLAEGYGLTEASPVVSGNPLDLTHSVLTLMYEATFGRIDFGYGAAISTLMTVIILALTALFIRAQHRQERAMEGR